MLDEVCRLGYCKITADQIKEFREPRLMTKFDHKVNLPLIFSENNLAILPITRGDYIISSFSAYCELEEPSLDIQRVSIPLYLQSLMPQYLVSETIAINCASATGILTDFLEDDDLVPTVSGRMGSGEFDYCINTTAGPLHIEVSNSQIEIDAAYEGIRNLSILEAKRDLSDDFLVRQLYYPYRVWSNRVTKPIKPVFFIFSNGVFYLYQYQFDDPKDYNSLHLVKQKNYMIETDITLTDLEQLLDSLAIVHESDIPFPQANSMSRVVNLMELLRERPLFRDEITSRYAFDSRQTNYYTDAGRYLGMIEKHRVNGAICFGLSECGQQIMALPYRERQLGIISQIMKHKVFRETLQRHLQCGEMPDVNTIMQIMKQSELFHVEADSTYFRRASTIIGWVNWILSIIESS
ncbi:MAG: transcriptional regulator [Oscillospiraceae bacterium]|nr:transcriptional regulator [Oscillospiraceae bacterium]